MPQGHPGILAVQPSCILTQAIKPTTSYITNQSPRSTPFKLSQWFTNPSMPQSTGTQSTCSSHSPYTHPSIHCYTMLLYFAVCKRFSLCFLLRQLTSTNRSLSQSPLAGCGGSVSRKLQYGESWCNDYSDPTEPACAARSTSPKRQAALRRS